MTHTSSTRSLFLTLSLCGIALASAPERVDATEETALENSRVFTARDFPDLASRGVKLPHKGRYTLKVWSQARQTWSLTNLNSILTLHVKVGGDDSTPRWQTAGAVDLPGGKAVKVVVGGPEDEAAKGAKDGEKTESESSAKDKTSDKNAGPRKGESKPGVVRPIPALLSLALDNDPDPTQALDLIRGRTDSIDPPLDPRRSNVRTNQEGAGFKPPADLQAWRDRARAVREQLLVTMGLWPLFPKTPLQPQVFGLTTRDGYTIEKVVLETLPGFTLAGNLYRPAAGKGKRPAVLCPHGHWEDGRVNPEVQQRCIRLAKLGCVVFMYDMVGYNDSKQIGIKDGKGLQHSFLNDRLRRSGFSLVTLQTWNSLRALDWLSGLTDVDPTRIGCTGESGGGTQTFLLTAIDDRVKVSAPIVMVSDSFQGGCVCENCAGLRIGTDNVEFAALTVPRPLKIVGATGDWTKLTMTNAYPTLRALYRLHGIPDRVDAEVFDFPHNYNQTTRNAVYPFLARWLLDLDGSEDVSEGKQTTEKPEDLWAFTPRTPPPANLKTARELENDLIRIQRQQLETLAPSTSPAAWEASRVLLQTSLKVRVGLVNPSPVELTHREVRRSRRDGLVAVHFLVGRRAVGEHVPVVRLTPDHPSGRLTVIANGRGKASLVGLDGKPAPLVQALLKLGQSVVGFDPLFVGESLDPANPVAHRPDTAHFETYNPSLAADQIQDLATVLAWARSLSDVREVNLIGQGLAGPQVLLARPLLEGLARTAIDLDAFSEKDGSTDLPAALDLPGLFQFGGLKSAAALTAPASIWVHGVGHTFDRSWPENAYALAGASSLLRLDSSCPAPGELALWIQTGE
ncbi:MAG: hypothetical protein NVSMB9_10290 [Isosphaeraceae bacterium]